MSSEPHHLAFPFLIFSCYDWHMVRIRLLVKPLSLAIAAISMAITAAHAQSSAPSNVEAKLNKDLVYKTTFGNDDEVLMLVERGANPHALNQEGVPALSLAATRKGDAGLSIIKALLASRVRVDQPDSNGQTALFYAARVGNLDAVQLLLQSGADYYHTDKKGNIARNVAFERGYIEVFNYMDSFINNQREEVLNAYKLRDEELQLRELEMMVAKNEAEQAKKELDAARKEVEGKSEALDKKLSAPTPKPQPEYKPVDEKEFNQSIRKLSYHSCVAQYWFYVRTARMKTLLSNDAILDILAAQRDAVTAEKKLLRSYGTNDRYIRRITQPSEQRIYEILDAFGSNVTLHSHGVGKTEDAIERCGKIADDWIMKF